jgi:hypothetical protein
VCVGHGIRGWLTDPTASLFLSVLDPVRLICRRIFSLLQKLTQSAHNAPGCALELEIIENERVLLNVPKETLRMLCMNSFD